MRVRRLRDPESGQTWVSQCEGEKVVIRAAKAGKERETAKAFDDATAAERYADKEEASRLRKGWILSEPAAAAGQPRMHRLLSGPYTGAMTIEAIGELLLCNHFGENRDKLYVMDADARMLDTIEAPQDRLIWQARYMADAGVVLLRADHQIMTLSLESRAFKALTPMNKTPASFLSTAGSLASWYAEPDVVVCDMKDGRTLFRKEILSQLYGGHSPQMSAQLSADGTALACCAQAGAIALFDVASGQVRGEIKGDFGAVDKMSFIANGRRLLVQERYAKWRLRCFDLDTMAEAPDWPKIEIKDFAVEASGQRLAITERTAVEIYELATMRRLLRFKADHAVKRNAVTFAGKYLAVLTDLGCVSLYALD
jgi:hypothetical protein